MGKGRGGGGLERGRGVQCGFGMGIAALAGNRRGKKRGRKEMEESCLLGSIHQRSYKLLSTHFSLSTKLLS